MELRDRIEAIESALRTSEEIDVGTGRHSTDHRFDGTPRQSIDHGVDDAPIHSSDKVFDPELPLGNPTETEESARSSTHSKAGVSDSIAANFGLGILDSEPFTEYTIYNAFLTNLRICPVDLSGSLYYVEHRSFMPTIPGVILHSGHDKSGPSLGVAHLPFAGANQIGIGDVDTNPSAVVWEKFAKQTTWTHMRYAFEHTLPNGERRRFLWIRTRNMVLDDQGDLVLVEEAREDLIFAEYLGKGIVKWKKRGRLRVRVVEAFGESWEVLVLLSWAAVVELSRRRARQRRMASVHLL